ncbi:unnamed protein product [Acanthoscelides obtectus]|uniref:Uncharacterized protein n=1 Tax=Acanthoscelides obtectus TaxID=200917 RepID=A0A9P0MI21_ACAOB|nr:unnamed protein product [Acanthoscelides obtectus]CAH2014524.1 unnamed protein product [Acanthoscelides obtectus]CAK1620118.1 hypothetical protein AOBTE_LOCUS211 [Acanthoscelides obtectus]CAK1620124.1 hypothetical protein AOBTE_LOCUS214 [Acanthoscelides obtectus]
MCRPFRSRCIQGQSRLMAKALAGPHKPTTKGCDVNRQAGTHGIGKHRRQHCVLESERGWHRQ